MMRAAEQEQLNIETAVNKTKKNKKGKKQKVNNKEVKGTGKSRKSTLNRLETSSGAIRPSTSTGVESPLPGTAAQCANHVQASKRSSKKETPKLVTKTSVSKSTSKKRSFSVVKIEDDVDQLPPPPSALPTATASSTVTAVVVKSEKKLCSMGSSWTFSADEDCDIAISDSPLDFSAVLSAAEEPLVVVFVVVVVFSSLAESAVLGRRLCSRFLLRRLSRSLLLLQTVLLAEEGRRSGGVAERVLHHGDVGGHAGRLRRPLRRLRLRSGCLFLRILPLLLLKGGRQCGVGRRLGAVRLANAVQLNEAALHHRHQRRALAVDGALAHRPPYGAAVARPGGNCRRRQHLADDRLRPPPAEVPEPGVAVVVAHRHHLPLHAEAELDEEHVRRLKVKGVHQGDVRTGLVVLIAVRLADDELARRIKEVNRLAVLVGHSPHLHRLVTASRDEVVAEEADTVDVVRMRVVRLVVGHLNDGRPELGGRVARHRSLDASRQRPLHVLGVISPEHDLLVHPTAGHYLQAGVHVEAEHAIAVAHPPAEDGHGAHAQQIPHPHRPVGAGGEDQFGRLRVDGDVVDCLAVALQSVTALVGRQAVEDSEDALLAAGEDVVLRVARFREAVVGEVHRKEPLSDVVLEGEQRLVPELGVLAHL
ncbi:hypothetical protein TYRP_016804 [Tyrophagus putrescentiae]|nr:hypothetical protein TYRP_016804 [Tyrophagus putrescentiae]